MVECLSQWGLASGDLKFRIQRERATLLSIAAQLNDFGVDRNAANREAIRSDTPATRNR